MTKHLRGWIVMGALSLAFAGLCQASEGYVLDQYDVKSTTVSPGAPIVIGKFSTENTDFGKLKKEVQ